MSLLAERKKKTKWVVNPTKKPLWTSDSVGIKFGKEIMEKMGWELGKGLGQKEQGILEPLKIAYKNDTKGMGFKGKDEEWIEQQDEFNVLLSQLANNGSSTGGVKENEKIKIKSLEEKSRQSRARVHYQKFTKSKDLSKYSANDLACILGTKMSRKNTKEQDQKIGSKEETFKKGYETSYGVTTIKSGFIHDYFNKKGVMAKPIQSTKNKLPESYNTNDNNKTLQNIASNLNSPEFKNKKQDKTNFESDEVIEITDKSNKVEVNFNLKKKKNNKREINKSKQENDCFNNFNEINKIHEVENIEISDYNTEQVSKRKKVKNNCKHNIESNLIDHVDLHNQNNEVRKKNNQEIERKSQPTKDEFTESETAFLKHSKNKRKKKDKIRNSNVEKIKFVASCLSENENDNLKAEYRKKKNGKKKEKHFMEKTVELCENEENLNLENKKEKKENKIDLNLLANNKNLTISTENILDSTFLGSFEEGIEYKEPSNLNSLENDLVDTDVVIKKRRKKQLRNFNAISEKEAFQKTKNLEKINEKKHNSEETVEKDVIYSHKMELFNKKKKLVCEKAKILKLRFGFEIEKFKGSNLTDLPGYGVKQIVQV